MPEKPKNTITSKNPNRNKQIFAIVLIVFGIFISLSIVSYNKTDEPILEQITFIDIFKIPFDEEIKTQAALIQNNLGTIGAVTSDFFVNSTVGFFSLIFPFLMIVWGWTLLRKNNFNRIITLTNFLVIFALLFSSISGVWNIGKEWSGLIGTYIADVTINLFGVIGASLILLTFLFLTIVFAIDLDIHKSLERFSNLWKKILALLSIKNHREELEDRVESDIVINKSDGDIEIQKVEDEQIEEPIMKQQLETEVIPQAKIETEEIEQSETIDESLQIEEKEIPKPVESELEEIDYVFPSIELLDSPRQADNVTEEELKANAELVKTKLANFGIEIENVSVTPGPVVTLYELVPASSVKISRIVSLADDLALALAAKGIRIMAPIPGKSAVGVEIPNKNPSTVSLRSVLNSNKFREIRGNLPIALGKTISGEVYTDDLAKMPHLLIAGSTGSGKSVGINTILASLLYRLHPSEVKYVIIDPKKIELALYSKLKHHFLAISPDTEEEIITTPENAVYALKGVESEMERRYDRLAAAGVRNIQDYNERYKAGRLKNTDKITHRLMPYLIVVIDELADLMLTAAREVEEPIARLAQLARAVGVHLVLATQRPSVDVITGVIKANFPARIAYQVATKIDSRTILDMNGAEQLLGSGDMLYLPAGSPKPIRIQNAFISTEEVERLTDHISKQQGYSKPFTLPSILEKKKSGLKGSSGSRDEFFEEAAKLVVRHQQGSVSLLQRRLKVGYSRAARIIDELEAESIVGPFDGSKARQVLIENEKDLDIILENLN